MADTTTAQKPPVRDAKALNFTRMGRADFSLGQAEYVAFSLCEGIPYIAYVDVANGYRATVMGYCKKTDRWVSVGEPGLSTGPVNCTCLYVDNGVPYVAFKERMHNSQVSVMKYNGIWWETVGGPVFRGVEINYLALYVDKGTPYVAFSESNRYRGRVMKYEAGKGWVQVGNSFSGKFVGYVSLYVDEGIPYVAYTEGDDVPWYTLGKLAVSKYSDNPVTGEAGWQPVGNLDFFGIAFYTSLYVYQGVPYVAYGDGDRLCKVSVAKCLYDDTQGRLCWTHLGKPGFSRGNVIYPSLDFDDGTPYVAFRDAGNNHRVTVMKFDGYRWIAVGEPGFSAGEVNYVSLMVQEGMVYVAYADGNNQDRATVMFIPDRNG